MQKEEKEGTICRFCLAWRPSGISGGRVGWKDGDLSSLGMRAPHLEGIWRTGGAPAHID